MGSAGRRLRKETLTLDVVLLFSVPAVYQEEPLLSIARQY